MQRISFRKVKTSVYHVQPADDDILHFSLDDLLPDGHTLALNLSLGTLSLIANSRDNSYPYLLAEQQFTTSELCVLVPLLKHYPYYCPYEVLLARRAQWKMASWEIPTIARQQSPQRGPARRSTSFGTSLRLL